MKKTMPCLSALAIMALCCAAMLFSSGCASVKGLDRSPQGARSAFFRLIGKKSNSEMQRLKGANSPQIFWRDYRSVKI